MRRRESTDSFDQNRQPVGTCRRKTEHADGNLLLHKAGLGDCRVMAISLKL